MSQLTLCRRLSVIHAVKCKKSTSFEFAMQSNDKLKLFFDRLGDIKEDELQKFDEDVQAWAESNPIATEQDIKELLKK